MAPTNNKGGRPPTYSDDQVEMWKNLVSACVMTPAEISALPGGPSLSGLRKMLAGRRRKTVAGPKPPIYNRHGKLPPAVQRAMLDEAEKIRSAYGPDAITIQGLARPANELLPVRAGGGKPGRQPSQRRRREMQRLQTRILRYFDSLISKVEKTSPTGCWLWTGRTRTRGGKLQLLTVNPTSKNLNCARRAVANLCGFKPQPRTTLKTTCRDELCVQPLHLIARA